MRAAIVIGILAAILVGSSAAPAYACGCGVLVGPSHSPIATKGEQAIVNWSGDEESMQIMLDVHSSASSGAIIIPTPSAAEVTAGDRRLFGLVADLVEPQTHYVTDWWGVGYLHPEVAQPTVTVLDRVRTGNLETVVLEASDTEGLAAWLAANDFAISAPTKAALEKYVDAGWSFAAVKLAAGAKLDGQLDPIKLTFPTDRLVYPARLAALDSAPHDLRLYVFDEQRTDIVKSNAPTVDMDGDIAVVWAGAVTDQRMTVLGGYLTAFDLHFENPKKQLTSEIGIVASEREADVQPELTRYRMVTLLGIPVGTLAVVWALLGLWIASAHLIGRRRAR